MRKKMIQNISNAVKNFDFGCSTLPTNVWILSHAFWETVVVTGHVVLFGWFLLPPVCGTLKGHLLGLQLTVTVVVVFIFIFLASAFLQMQVLEAKAKEITLIISWGWSHFGCNCKLQVNLFCQNLHPFLSVSHKIPSFIIVYQMVNGTARI